MAIQTFNAFTAASSSLADYQILDALPNSKPGGNDFARFFANGNHASGTATLELVLVKKGVVVASFTATVTATARRTAADNGSGNYLSTVSFAETGTSTIDLLGCTAGPSGKVGAPGLTYLNDDGAVWMLGCTALTNFTSLVVNAAVSPAEC